MYVVGKDMSSNTVLVAEGGDHPAMYAETALLAAPHWVAGAPPLQLTQGQPLQLHFKARYGQPLHACAVQQAAAAAAFQPTQLSCYPNAAVSGAAGDIGSQLVVTFQRPMRAITPGQEFVLYDGEVCLGAAPVLAAGPSLWEQGRLLPVGLAADDSLHMAALEQQETAQRQAAVC
jgi:tRNA-specific 2-thiouridylase